MATRLALATLSAGEPMGQQVYERQLADRGSGALGSGWQVDPVVVRTLRTAQPGSVRIPAALLGDASPVLRRAAGRFIYRRYDLVHRLDLRLPPAPYPEVLTVLDIAPWRFADEGAPVADAAATARRAVTVICPSQFSADEVVSAFGVVDPVVIPLGVDEAFVTADPLSEPELADLGIRGPFVMHAAGCTRRKNLAGLAAAWTRVRDARPDTVLVLTGPPDQRRDQLFAPLPGALRLGRVAPGVLPRLMAAAAAVAVPSTYEGFGLPALEGMAVGVPVVAARRSSLPEVVGDGAYLVEPDAGGLADGLLAALAGGAEARAVAERGRARAHQLTWDISVAAHAEAWRSLAG
jgi:glycosyltransferase involved in cell wall biosynthesis